MHYDRFWHGGAYSRESLDAEEERDAEGRAEALGGVDVEVGDYLGVIILEVVRGVNAIGLLHGCVFGSGEQFSNFFHSYPFTKLVL